MGYFVLSESAADKLRRLIGDEGLIEVRASASEYPGLRPMNDPVHFVRVTSDAPTSGTYTGYWQRYLAEAGTWEDGEQCRVREAAGGTLTAKKYLARRYGLDADSYPVFMVSSGAASGFRGFVATAGSNTRSIGTLAIPQTDAQWEAYCISPYTEKRLTWSALDYSSGDGTLGTYAISNLTAGFWQFNAQVMWENSNSSGDRALGIGMFVGAASGDAEYRWNVQPACISSADIMQRVSCMGHSPGGYSVVVRAYQSSGSTLTAKKWRLEGIYLGELA